MVWFDPHLRADRLRFIPQSVRKFNVIPNLRYRFSVVALLAIFASVSLTASAANRTPVYYAAEDYREAVRSFERQVLRTPRVSKSVDRLVDDLEDSTSRLKSAARDPARFDRLWDSFVKTDALHARVELTFFGDSLYPPDPRLESCWLDVARCYSGLVQEVLYLRQIRQARRGCRIPIVNHSGAYSVAPVAGAPALGAIPSYEAPTANYRSEYDSTFREQTFGPRPSLEPRAYGPAFSPSASRAPEAPVTPTRRKITTSDQLRSAVIGAILQRK